VSAKGGFAKGDPRAAVAGRRGGQASGTARRWRTPEYIRGYQAGARTERRRWERIARELEAWRGEQAS